MKNSKIVKSLAVIVINAFAAWGAVKELTQNESLCIFVAVLSFLTIIGVIFYILKKQQVGINCVTAFICAVLLFAAAIWSFEKHRSQVERTEIWNESLLSYHDSQHESLLELASHNDGPTLYALALEEYMKHNYVEASHYAQRAADNGNASGFILLSHLYLHGLGCTPNVQLAIASQIKANRINSIDNTGFLQEIEELGVPLQEKDKVAFDQCIKYVTELENILGQMSVSYSKYGDEGVKQCFKKHHERLSELSAMGYIPATKLLYEEARLNNPDDKEAIRPLVEIMYQANAIPTAPIHRFFFYSYLYDFRSYCASNIEHFIKNNVYPAVFIDDLPLYNNLSDHDAYLIQNYLINKAQYEYCHSLVNGNREKYDLEVFGGYNYERDFQRSRMSLLSAIDSVRIAVSSLKR